jgi:hypothetical protein
MKLSNRRLWLFGAIAIGAIILLTFLAAPASNKVSSGSTYSRSPDGYGAWYAFMSERGTPVKRWQKPFEDLANNKNAKPPITLLRVNSTLTGDTYYDMEQEWVKKGNTLVILGVYQPVTEAPFSTIHKAGDLSVKIDTQRREKKGKEGLLGDRFGTIVWQESIGKGQVIYATTRHLAANAYQDFQGNYEFLAQLVTQSEEGERGRGGEGEKNQLIANSQAQNSVWVDEYIHGYRDPDVLACQEQGSQGRGSQPGTSPGRGSQPGTSQGRGSQSGTSPGNRKGSAGTTTCNQKPSLFSYLAKTPVFPALVQGLILLLVAIWAGNRRFGKPLSLSAPVVDNSEAYIQALAGVLQKANSSEFIVEVVGKDEQLQLQKALFLGQEQLDHQSLVNAWVQQTGHPAKELEQLLQMPSQKQRMSETDLLRWLEKWEQIRRHLSS